jgi:acetyl esterase/lipase
MDPNAKGRGPYRNFSFAAFQRFSIFLLMKFSGALVVSLLLIISACDRNGAGSAPGGGAQTLQEARQGFQTRLTRQSVEGAQVPAPPRDLFRTIKYKSPVGDLPAYVSVVPNDTKKRPAIIWLVGGFDNSIGDVSWTVAPSDDDQSAREFRDAGIVMMFPALRGGNTGPGFKEGFFGEVDDALAAADYLAQQPSVDPNRIYLGGHSTGGTLALLVAACSNRFRAVFALGPVAEAHEYGGENVPFDVKNSREAMLRAPVRWLHSIQTPTFVFEGTSSPNNLGDLKKISRANKNPLVHAHPVKGGTHFSIITPLTRHIAQKIMAAESPEASLTFSEKELAAVVPR